MKTFVYIFVVFLLFLEGCKKSELEQYCGVNYLQFSESISDSTTLSFTFYPNQDEIEWPVGVETSGLALNQDTEYRIAIDTEQSTAIEGTHVRLPEKLMIKSGVVADTFRIAIIRTPEMKTQDIRLVLKVVDNASFKSGQWDYTYRIIRINDRISKPDWWDDMITDYYLGEYSDKKFSLFIEVTGISDMSKGSMNESEVRTATLQFKYWLQREKEADRTVLEEDNTEMTVKVIG